MVGTFLFFNSCLYYIPLHRSESVSVTDFKSSWRNGMAFLAVIHALRPDLIDMDNMRHRSSRENLQEAFRIAEHELKIPKLLEPEGRELFFSLEDSLF